MLDLHHFKMKNNNNNKILKIHQRCTVLFPWLNQKEIIFQQTFLEKFLS